jgi:U32 family peptidase
MIDKAKIGPDLNKPQILAPAGNKDSFLAALAAGADAVYCGLKRYSARMEAQNFSVQELASLTRLAHEKGTHVYVTVNTLVTPRELDDINNLLNRLNQTVHPDALIIQDLGVVQLARRIGFEGELILSTLANVSFPEALQIVKRELGIDRVVMPRELNIDEIRAMAAACPEDLALEVFAHGALCYAVSGRCYWSSYLGGKSSLRGRCVQPCRRMYRQQDTAQRRFSCQDLSLDVLTKVLLTIPQIRNWKIEGRKKSPHYVFYTVKAYQLLRDHGKDPSAKKDALALLEQSLGRTGTHYNFLPQRPQNPVHESGRTASGLFVGNIQGGGRSPYLVPREPLLAEDVLRIGYEDSQGHGIQKIRRYVPKKGRFHFNFLSKNAPPRGTPVFLIDRREKALDEMLKNLESEMAEHSIPPSPVLAHRVKIMTRALKKKPAEELRVYRNPGKGGAAGRIGLWLDKDTPPATPNIWWWLPPVIWPEDETALYATLKSIIRKGGRHFVLNAPWQSAFFKQPKEFNLWAGPFCNISNPLAIECLADQGFSGIIVGPELQREDLLLLPGQSALPLGIVISANWPLCVARTVSPETTLGTPFTSPKGEQAWIQKNDSNYWIYPNWRIDLTRHTEDLKAAGYSLLVSIEELVPKNVTIKKRPGIWNWEKGLL